MEREVLWFRVWIQEIRKHGKFREPNYMLFYLCNFFYRIVERFPFICGCRHGWPNQVKISCIFVRFILYLFVFE